MDHKKQKLNIFAACLINLCYSSDQSLQISTRRYILDGLPADEIVANEWGPCCQCTSQQIMQNFITLHPISWTYFYIVIYSNKSEGKWCQDKKKCMLQWRKEFHWRITLSRPQVCRGDIAELFKEKLWNIWDGKVRISSIWRLERSGYMGVIKAVRVT